MQEWYIHLYTNSDEGGKPLPRGILGTEELCTPFLVEFCAILYHIPAFLDFRYWCCRTDAGNEGIKKPFISDKWNMLLFLRAYLWIRVMRDSSMLYRRRFQIYEGGYRRRGGPPITWSEALRHMYVGSKPKFAANLVFWCTLAFSYISYNAERDFQPGAFTMKACHCY
jgi:hypothetical protein